MSPQRTLTRARLNILVGLGCLAEELVLFAEGQIPKMKKVLDKLFHGLVTIAIFLCVSMPLFGAEIRTNELASFRNVEFTLDVHPKYSARIAKTLNTVGWKSVSTNEHQTPKFLKTLKSTNQTVFVETRPLGMQVGLNDLEWQKRTNANGAANVLVKELNAAGIPAERRWPRMNGEGLKSGVVIVTGH